jgi:hypothetical protein
VVRISSRIKRGRYAIRTRIGFSITGSMERKYPLAGACAKDSKMFPEGVGSVGGSEIGALNQNEEV